MNFCRIGLENLQFLANVHQIFSILLEIAAHINKSGIHNFMRIVSSWMLLCGQVSLWLFSGESCRLYNCQRGVLPPSLHCTGATVAPLESGSARRHHRPGSRFPRSPRVLRWPDSTRLWIALDHPLVRSHPVVFELSE